MSDFAGRIAHLSPLKLAFAAQQFDEKRVLMGAEPIAIIGMACRFPGGAHDPESFWRLLKDGVDAIGDVPADRWDMDAYYDPDPGKPGKIVCRKGGFLEQIDRFDAAFFGISPREAVSMDPQQRLLLEVSWEALERSNQLSGGLLGSDAGVFIGISTFDYAARRLVLRDRKSIDAYYVSGTTLSVAAGRLSYLLGLTGPCMSIDTACSSSLVGLHLACQSLRGRECSLALAGGVGLILAPEPAINFSQARMLAPDGRCKTFDAAADGYVRGEGCGVVVLKRLADALADGDTILALVRGSAVNQDGPSGGLTVPNGPSQEEVVRRAMTAGGLEPGQISYVEAHGTGTSLGDPIEVNALARSLCRDRDSGNPLILGSVKTNIGHLEAAAGVAGIIKVVLALRNREIPAHLHFQIPNPHIDWETLPLEVAAEAREWLPREGRRIAGVSAFGFSGTNAHVILEEAPSSGPEEERERGGLNLLVLSAKSEEALNHLADLYAQHISGASDRETGDICATANVCRLHFAHRLAIVASSRSELAAKLLAVNEAGRNGLPSGIWRSGQAAVASRPEIQTSCNWSLPDEELRPFLEGIAGEYVTGVNVDGEKLYENRSWSKVILPTYPFQRESFWFEAGEGAEGFPGVVAPPGHVTEGLPGRRLHLPLSRDIRFEATVHRGAPAFLEDHQLFGTVVIAGATYVSLLLQAVKECFPGEEISFEDLLLEQVLTMGEKESLLLQTIIALQAEGLFALHVVSGSSDETGGGKWTTHLSGKARTGQKPLAAGRSAQEVLDLRDEAVRGWKRGKGSELYEEIARMGHHLGSSFQWIQKTWQRDHEAVCLLERPESPFCTEDFPLYPGLVDSCFQFFCIRGLSLVQPQGAGGREKDVTFIPFSFGRVRFQGASLPASRLWCHILIREYDELSKGLTGDILLADDEGRTILVIEAFRARKISRDLVRKSLKEDRDECLYRVEWRPMERGRKPASAEGGRNWLVFADEQGVGSEVAALLRCAGDSCALVSSGTEYGHLGNGHYRLNPAQPDHFLRLLDECLDKGEPLKGIVYLWSLDSGPVASPTALEHMESLTCGGLLNLLQVLGNRKGLGQPRLWLVTEGGQGVTGDELRLSSHQSLLWGLGSVIRREQGELKCTCIDLDPADSGAQAPVLCEVLCRGGREERIASRNGLPYAARLVSCPMPGEKEFSLAPDATYLITGGLGALGLETARWLAGRGAKNLVLLGRSKASVEARRTIAEVQAGGVRIEVIPADCAKKEDVLRLMEEIAAKMPPLRGIIHAAGVLEDGVLLKQEPAQLKRALAPKVEGTWHLHEATGHLKLDFFVCYSSIASVLGSAGQGNYAAANAFLDVFVQERRRQGLPGLAVNWGAWDRGMAAGLDSRDRERIRAQGLESITPARGFGILERLLLADATGACVLPVTWSTYLDYHYHGDIPAFFDEVAEKRDLPARKSHILNKLEQAPAREWRDLIFDYVRDRVVSTLRMKSPSAVPGDRGIFDLGIDSLMAVEIKNRLEADLGRSLRPTLLFDYPTVEAITGYLLRELTEVQLSGREERTDLPEMAPTLLSAAEVDGAIMDELAKLESLLQQKAER